MTPEEKIPVERHAFKGLVLYEITEDELDRIENEVSGASDDFSVASIAFSVAVSFAIALATTKIESNHVYTVFWLLVIVGAFLTILYGIKWLRGRKKRRSIAQKIRARIGPLGDEAKEIAPGNLAALGTRENKEDKP